MIELGTRSQIEGVEQWKIFHILVRPKRMPKVPPGHTIICGVELAGTESEYMKICETPEDILLLWSEHAMGRIARIRWYHTNAFEKKPKPAAA